MTNQAQALREEANEHHRKSEESFQRSDTDGFLSQWAHDITGRKLHLQADIEEAGGFAEFPALFHAETGERVKAKLVYVQSSYSYGQVPKWIVLDDNNNAVHWVPAFKTGKRSKMYQLGLAEGTETAKAKAELAGGGRGLSGAANVQVVTRRLDKGYPESARTLESIRRGR